MKGLIKKSLVVSLSIVIFGLSLGNTDVFAKGGPVHNVTFIYGTKSITVPVAHGQNAPIPTDTAVPGFQFVTWVGSAANVTEDRVILGSYAKTATPSQLTVVPLNIKKVNNNKSAPFPEWWSTLNLPKGTPGVTCAVHWMNGHNGELWKTDIVPYGGSLPNPADPCIAGYDFVGWEGDWTNVTEDRCIKAWYYTSHKVYFVDTLDNNDIWFDEKNVYDGDGTWADAPSHAKDNKKFDHYEYADGVRYEGQAIHNDVNIYAVYRESEGFNPND